MRILLTGSSGYFGTRFITLYSNVFNILGLSRTDKEPIDLNDAEIVERSLKKFKPDFIIHTAAQVGRDSYNSESIIAETKKTITPLLDSAINTGTPFIFTSTEAVYGGKEKTGNYSETDPLKPRNAYGQAKVNSEKMIQRSGLPYLITRGHRYVGYNPDFNKPKQFPDTLKKIINNNQVTLDSEKLFTPVHIDTICHTIFHYIKDRKNEQDLINIGIEKPVTFFQLMRDVAKGLGKEHLVKTGGNEQGWPENSSLNTQKSRSLNYPHLKYTQVIDKIIDDLTK